MRQFNNKKINRFWHSPIILFVLFCILLVFIYNVFNLINIEREAVHNKKNAMNKVEELRDKEISLNADISKLKTEEGQEEIIREKYPVGKEGEKMVTIIDDKDNGEQDSYKSTGPSFGEWFRGLFSKK